MAGLRRELMGEMLGELVLQHGDGRYEEEVCSVVRRRIERKAHAHDAEGQVKVANATVRGFFPLDQRLQLIEQLSWSPGNSASRSGIVRVQFNE